MKTYILLLLTFGMLGTFPLKAADLQAVATTTTSTGTLSEFAPGTSFVVREDSGPMSYDFGPEVIYTTSSGAIIPEPELRTRMQVGSPVSVHYVTQGDRRLINRVVVDEHIQRVNIDDDDDDDDDD
jgi:hypothetical protein